MAGRPLKPAEKREVLNDLLYHYGMVLGAVLRWMKTRDGKIMPRIRDQLDRNAIRIECFAMRWRTLMEFFYGHERSRPHRDDVFATEFIADWSARAPAKYPEFDHDRERVNKQIAHIGLKRILQRTKDGTGKDQPFNTKSWKHERMVKLAMGCMGAFFEVAASEVHEARNFAWALDWERELVSQAPAIVPALVSKEQKA